MKNLFLIPTLEPSMLYLGNNGNFVFGIMRTSIQSRNDDFTNQKIYITLDEEIKEGDWFIELDLKGTRSSYINKHYLCDIGNTGGFILTKNNGNFPFPNHCKKIILTTDQDLIKEGIQAIDDEFLEWFVKNPSCEEVKIKPFCEKLTCQNKDCSVCCQELKYKIIIPKEEQKQHLIDIMRGDEELGLYEEPKQETLEEAAEKWYDSTEENKGFPKIKAFKEGAKWQQQNSYSEEEVLNIVSNCDGSVLQAKKWLEQFKKK